MFSFPIYLYYLFLVCFADHLNPPSIGHLSLSKYSRHFCPKLQYQNQGDTRVRGGIDMSKHFQQQYRPTSEVYSTLQTKLTLRSYKKQAYYLSCRGWLPIFDAVSGQVSFPRKAKRRNQSMKEKLIKKRNSNEKNLCEKRLRKKTKLRKRRKEIQKDVYLSLGKICKQPLQIVSLRGKSRIQMNKQLVAAVLVGFIYITPGKIMLS